MPPAVLKIGAILSLTGRFARFGVQAANGLRVWSELTAGVEIVFDDDGGEPSHVEPGLDNLATRCDLLLGPYSTVLMRAAATFAARSNRLVWNHGGSGDDVQSSAPGRVVSVLTPTSRYTEPFVRHLADQHPSLPLRLAEGRGSFGRQVVAGARETARRLRVPLAEATDETVANYALFAAGTFEDDTTLISRVIAGRIRPVVIGTVAAGVREFAKAVPDPNGVFGIAQWVPGRSIGGTVGPPEVDFLSAYREAYGAVPDYPAVQAVAAAALALHCARQAGSTADEELWAVATQLTTSTFFGGFSIDPASGAQRGHQMALVRWQDGRMQTA